MGMGTWASDVRKKKGKLIIVKQTGFDLKIFTLFLGDEIYK
jgi:hypothetical protein